MTLISPKIAVPWGSFTVKQGENRPLRQLSLDATKDKLERRRNQAGDATRLYGKGRF